MSINRDMRQWILQLNDEIRSPSGSAKENWRDVDVIKAAVYQKEEARVIASARYQECSHTGVTYYKKLDKKKSYRIVNEQRCFEIVTFNAESRLTNLILKEVDSYGQ